MRGIGPYKGTAAAQRFGHLCKCYTAKRAILMHFRMTSSLFRTSRHANAILPVPKSRFSHRFNSPTGKLLVMFLILGTIVIAIFLTNPNFISISAASNFIATFLPHVFSKVSHSTSYSSFSSLHPIFTRRVSPDALFTILENRRRITRSTVNTTLIAACSSTHPFTARVLASWNAIHAVQQIIIVHYFSAVEDVHRSLSLIDDIDKPGQIIYVAIEARKENIRYSSPSPTPRGRVRRWPRTRAYNLGAKIALGHNLFFVDCGTIVSPDALVSHRIVGDSIFVRVGEAPPDGSGVRPVQMVYVQRRTFLAVHGMDERIDIPGFDMADFVERATRKTLQTWRFMRTKASQDVPSLDSAPLVIDVAADQTHADPLSAHYPELVLYVTALSRGEMPPWTGKLPSGESSIISLHDVNFRMLRAQSDPFDDARRFRFRVGRSRRVDFRLWIYATVPDTGSALLVSALPHNVRVSIVLQAHRKLLHDHYGLPWKLLDIIETPEKADVISQGNDMTLDLSALTPSAGGVEVLLKEPHVQLLKTWRYTPILFNVVWRKAKLLVVNIDSDTAMELTRSVAWALTVAIAHSRALVLTGGLRGTALVHLFDANGMKSILQREYNISIDIIAREKKLPCTPGNQTSHSCWLKDDVKDLWVESRLRIGVSDVVEDSSRHLLIHIAGREMLSWDARTDTTEWLREMEEKAFACLSVSQRVASIVEKLSISNLHNRTAVWITRSGRHQLAVGTFVARYLHIKKDLNMSIEMRPLVILSDDSSVGVENEQSREADAYYSMADLWIALQSERIVFNTGEMPPTWRGIDEGLAEWRRMRRVNIGKGEHGVMHLRSPDDKSFGLSFHELVLNVHAVKKADDVTGQTSPAS